MLSDFMQIEEIIKALRISVCWELTERMEYTNSETAKILGITPAAISLYSTGKRGSGLSDKIRSSKKLYKIASSLAEDLSDDYRKGNPKVNKRLIEAAEKLLPYIEKTTQTNNTDLKSVNRILRERLIEEQKSANELSNISVKFKDEALKQLISTMEIDSIRHGEMVAAIMERLNKHESAITFTKADKKAIDKLIEDEESVDDEKFSEIKSDVDPISRILIESIESDERKHVEMLRKLSKIMKEGIK